MKDYFSKQSENYSKYRPAYPDELFDYILGYVPEKKLAWDCGTGNGQSAVAMAARFESVYASDISVNQVSNAVKRNNIRYVIEPAESCSLADNTVNLVTVSQALHWFHFDQFYAEAKRVSAPNGIIAVWTYPLMKIDPLIDRIIDEFYAVKLNDYWDKERCYVDEEYKTIPFPFTELPSRRFNIEVNWNLYDLEGYLNTWSALQKYISINNENPVALVIQDIREHWAGNEYRVITFPVYLRIGKVH